MVLGAFAFATNGRTVMRRSSNTLGRARPQRIPSTASTMTATTSPEMCAGPQRPSSGLIGVNPLASRVVVGGGLTDAKTNLPGNRLYCDCRVHLGLGHRGAAADGVAIAEGANERRGSRRRSHRLRRRCQDLPRC